jgi:hypothetical protein
LFAQSSAKTGRETFLSIYELDVEEPLSVLQEMSRLH